MVFGESHGKRLDGGVFFGKTRRHVAGVNAAAQERSHFNIGYVVVAHAFAHGLVNGVNGRLFRACVVRAKRGLPIALHFQGAIGVNCQAMSRRKLEHALEKRFRQRRELEAQILLKRFAIKLAMISGVLQNAFNFACEDELPLLLRIVKRLDAEEIARAEKFFVARIPKGKGEHAAQALQHIFAPLQITY